MQHPPILKVQIRAIASLIPSAENAREHPTRQIQQLAKSIQTFGFNCPVLVDLHDNVIAGHGRLLAAKTLGWQEVPTICLQHLTRNQVKAYRIADNQLTDNSIWNDRLLAEQLKELSSVDLDFDLTATGLELPEIDLRIQSLDAHANDDEVPASEFVGRVGVSRLGDIWQLGAHQIVCGNALDRDVYFQLLDGSTVPLVFTDPPYNVPISGHVMGNGRHQHPDFAMASGEMTEGQFTQFLADALGLMVRASVQGALLYVCMDWRHLVELSAAAKSHALLLKNLCVWDKGTGGMGSFYRSQHELVFVFKNGAGPTTNNIQLGRFGRNRTNVWAYPGVNSFARQGEEGDVLALHPTVKPTALVADVLLDASKRGEAVLDPFLGSGTTLLAAERTGRVAKAIECDPAYVDVAVRRWQQLTGGHAVLISTGESFADREAALSRRSGTSEVRR